MSVIIDWKNKTILDCSKGVMYGLYCSISDVIDEQNLDINKNVLKLINRLDVASDGIGFDLINYIYSKDDLNSFLDLLRKGIDRHYIEIPNLPPYTKNDLENFYTELTKIKNSSFTN